MSEVPGTGTVQTLFSLGRKARASKSMREAGFLIANETRHLVDYRQAALWVNGEGMFTLSGVVQIEANVPYVQWVSEVVGNYYTHVHDWLVVDEICSTAAGYGEVGDGGERT